MAESIKELRGICQKKHKKEVLYFRIVRIFSIYFTKLFLMLRISANAVSFLSVFVGLIAIGLFATGDYWMVLAGAIVLQLANTFDCCDGEIARYTKKTNVRGLIAEYALHFSVQPLMFVFLAYGSFRNLGEIYLLLLGFSSAICVILQEIIMMMIPFIYIYFKRVKNESALESCRKSTEKTETKEKLGRLSLFIHRIYDFFGFIYRYSTISAVVVIAAIFDFVDIMIIFYGLTYPFVIMISYAYHFFGADNKMKELIEEIE